MRGVLTLVGAIQLTLVGAKVLDARRCDRSGACSPIAVSCHVAGMPDKPPTYVVCRRDSPEIDRSDSTPRVRDARSVVLAQAVPVYAAMAGVGDGHYSRRDRTSMSVERFPAGVAGRRNGRYGCDVTLVGAISTNACRCNPADACRCDGTTRRVAGMSDQPVPFGARRAQRSGKASEAIHCREFVTRDP